MKKSIVLLFICVILLSCQESGSAGDNNDKYAPREDLDKPETFEERMSYMFGYDLNRGLAFLDSNNNKINFDYLILGLYHGMKDTNIFKGGSENPIALMTLEERTAFIQELQQMQVKYQRDAEQREKDKFKALGDDLLPQGIEYLNENQNKEGWKVTESGLQYKVIKETGGEKANDNLVVEAHVLGKLTNGTVFDDTRKRGKPIELPVDGLNQGLKEGIKMMGVGSVYEFVIPSQLAFGPLGSGSTIPPNAVLIMHVELLRITGTKEEFRKRRMSSSKTNQSNQNGQQIEIIRK